MSILTFQTVSYNTDKQSRTFISLDPFVLAVAIIIIRYRHEKLWCRYLIRALKLSRNCQLGNRITLKTLLSKVHSVIAEALLYVIFIYLIIL